MNLKEENKIILIYLILGSLWIYFSDKALLLLFDDRRVISEIQTYKGWIFVVYTGIVFYILIKSYFTKIREAKEELRIKNQVLNEYNIELEHGNRSLKRSYEDLSEQTEDLKIMIDFINNINKEKFLKEDKFLSLLLRTAAKLISKSDYGSIYKIMDDKVAYVDAIGHNFELLKSLQIKKSVFSVHKNKPQIINNLLERDKNMVSQEKYEVLQRASKNIEQSLTFSLTVDDEMIAGISLDIEDKSKKHFVQDDIETLAAFRNLAESFYTLQRYNKLQGEFQRDIILSMIKFLEVHDKYTGGHSEEVANLSIMIAESLDLSKKEINDAYWAGLVHDIGKLLIPKKILNKKQKLTDSDYSLIQNHPYWAYTALKQTKKLDSIAKYVLYHHERWDGKGYPEGVKGEQIPLISRIIAVADAYSAMTSDRAYRDALSNQEAFRELKKGSNKQFDPEIVKIIIKNVDS